MSIFLQSSTLLVLLWTTGCSLLIDVGVSPEERNPVVSGGSVQGGEVNQSSDLEREDMYPLDLEITQDLSQLENQDLEIIEEQDLDMIPDQELDQDLSNPWTALDSPPSSLSIHSIEWIFIPPASRTFKDPNESSNQVEVIFNAFQVSKSEVTVWQYSRCVRDGQCSFPLLQDRVDEECNWWNEQHGDHPMNCISLCDALDFAQWVEGRLLSESEWYHLATLGENPYPWGEFDLTCERAHYQACSPQQTQRVCSLSQGSSLQVGLCDLMGNVAEWLADEYRMEWPYYQADATPFNPLGSCSAELISGEPVDGFPTPRSSVVRGGHWKTIARDLTPELRRSYNSTLRSSTIGFRVAKD